MVESCKLSHVNQLQAYTFSLQSERLSECLEYFKNVAIIQKSDYTVVSYQCWAAV